VSERVDVALRIAGSPPEATFNHARATGLVVGAQALKNACMQFSCIPFHASELRLE
jgi:hypothetical protein